MEVASLTVLKFKGEAPELIPESACCTCAVIWVSVQQVRWWHFNPDPGPQHQDLRVRRMVVYVTRVPPAWTGPPCSVLHPEPRVLPYLTGYFKSSHTGLFALVSFCSAFFLLRDPRLSLHHHHATVNDAVHVRICLKYIKTCLLE